MSVDLSRSIDRSFRDTLERADQLAESGQTSKAAPAYREAARLSRTLAKYAVSRAEKSRRIQRADHLLRLAEQVADQPVVAGAKPSEEQSEETERLQAQIDALMTRSEVSWHDIGGLKDAKRMIQLGFGMSVARKPEGVAIDAVRNMLLYGPPGTGKSLLAAAVSNGLRATFFNVSASQLLSKWFGESPRLISLLFATARRRAPSVVFLDELESLFPSRDASTNGAERRVLSTLLAELSGFANSGSAPTVFTIGATNAPWLMDSAALSRFGRRIYVPLPDRETRRAVLEIHLIRKGHRLDFSLDQLVKETEGLSGRQLSHLAATAVERMVAESNTDLADVAASGSADLADYQIQTRPISWSDVESVLARIKPDTSPNAVRRFEAWQTTI